MNNVEERLHAAAEETRRLAQERPPRRLIVERAPTRPGWLVFAAGFAAVLLTFGLMPWLIGNGDPSPAGSTPVASTPMGSTTVPDTGGASCSSDGIPTPGETNGLPDPVARTRQEIIEAAAGCDIGALEILATDGFTTAFGGGGVENLSDWEESGEGRLGTLLQILDLSYGTVNAGDRAVVYVWPAAFAYESWDDIPQDLMAELRQVYTQEELDQIAVLGSYGGWRTGTDEDGNWQFFVAGD